MKTYLKKIWVWGLLLVFVFDVSGCVKPYRIHPELKERQKDIFTAAVVDPEVEAYLLTFQGDQKRMHEVIPVMQNVTVDEINLTLEKKGYIVQRLDLTEENLNANPDLRSALFNSRKLFLKSINDINKRKKKKFTYSIGSDVNIFAEESDADMLIFVREDGVKKSSGEVMKDVVKNVLIAAAFAVVGGTYVGSSQSHATVVHIAAVDSNDGALLWYVNNASYNNYDPSNERHMKSLVKSLIKYLPESANKNKLRITEKEKDKIIESPEIVSEKDMQQAGKEGVEGKTHTIGVAAPLQAE